MKMKSCAICSKLLLPFFFYYVEISKIREIGLKNLDFGLLIDNETKTFSGVALSFFRFHKKNLKNVIWNSNLELLIHKLNFTLRRFFIFHLNCIKYRVFWKKTVKSNRVPNSMQFFNWNHRSRYTYSVLNLFLHLGMLFWVLAKMWEVA